MNFKYCISHIIFILLLLIGLSSCKKATVTDTPDIDTNQNDIKKQFVIYEWLGYTGTPDLSSEKISKIHIIYENNIVKKDPNTDKYTLELDVEKLNLQADLAAMKGIRMINTDVEYWYGLSAISGKQMEDVLTDAFNLIRKKIPDARFGNYGLPASALCVARFRDAGKSDEETLLKTWRNGSKKRAEASAAVDYFSPSLYIAEPNIASWIKDLETTIKELKAIDANKKIYVYLWPQYYDIANSPYYKQFVSPEIWEQMLEAAYKYCDGVIIWAGGSGPDDKMVQWSDPRVQSMMNTTRKFIAKHDANIILDKPEALADPGVKEPTNFHLYHSISFPNTPDLTPYGIKKIQYISEKDLSGSNTINGILVPDIQKIENFALEALKNPDRPVCIYNNNWITDRTTNNQAMAARFKLIHDTFKSKNTVSQLGFIGIGPTSMSSFRLTAGYVEDKILNSWFVYAAEPMRVLRNYSDIILPTPYLIDDDLETWKRDCSKIMKEARNQVGTQPIFAYIRTNYSNNKDAFPFFADANKPIKEAIWLEMLEYLYLRCDGIIIASNATSSYPVTWSEDLGFWKATKTFINRHKNVIAKL